MSDWQTRLSDLPGLPADDKLYLEGKLLLIDDVKAARYFKDNEPPEATIKRLRALLPEAGETIDKAHKVHSRGLHRVKPGLCLMPLNLCIPKVATSGRCALCTSGYVLLTGVLGEG